MNFKNKDIKEGKEVMLTFEIKTMSVPAEWFKDWFNSPYHDLLYSQGNEKEAPAFINRLISFLEPPAGSFFLESACGKGKHSQLLASYGYDVTGIDLSFNGIDEALLSASETLHFFQHDLRLPFWINYFHYAFNFFTRFGYFKSDREHYNAIRTIANSLKSNGMFVLDYLNVHYVEENLVHKSDLDIDGIKFTLTNWYDETHIYRKIIVEDGQWEQPLIYQEKFAKFSLGDFNDMLSFHHLQIQQVFGDYQFNHYDVKKSPRLILMAKKR
ncbi:MAG: class I SAM-dependent methyltransferase [Chitinophagaceae bacterium]